MLGAGAPNERKSNGDIFNSHFHGTNIVNHRFDAKKKFEIGNILSAF